MYPFGHRFFVSPMGFTGPLPALPCLYGLGNSNQVFIQIGSHTNPSHRVSSRELVYAATACGKKTKSCSYLYVWVIVSMIVLCSHPRCAHAPYILAHFPNSLTVPILFMTLTRHLFRSLNDHTLETPLTSRPLALIYFPKAPS